MTSLLLQHQLRILEVDEPWIDELMGVESDAKDDDGYCCLHSLLRSEELEDFNFECPRFAKLFQMQMNCIDNYGFTILMNLCHF